MASIIEKNNRKRIQEDDSDLPYDITFEIIENDKCKGRKIKAHKSILAAFNPVFKRMFCGALKETKDVIPVEPTTAEAFENMIKFLYHVDIDYKNMTVSEIFDLVNLAERYDVPKLMQELMVRLTNVPLAMNNFMEVAHIASEFSQFEDASAALLLHCAKYFHEELTEPREQVKFVVAQQSEGRGIAALKLLSLAESMPPAVCENCREKDCLAGRRVPRKKLFRGQHVMANMKSSYWKNKGKMLRFSVINYDREQETVTVKAKDLTTAADLAATHGSPYGPVNVVYPAYDSTLLYDCQFE